MASVEADSKLVGDIIGIRMTMRVMASVLAAMPEDDDDQNLLMRRMREIAHGTLAMMEVEFSGYDEAIVMEAAKGVIDQAFRDFDNIAPN